METRDVIGFLIFVGERCKEKARTINAVFIDFGNSFYHTKWHKLIFILKKLEIDWKDGRLNKDLYLNQNVTETNYQKIFHKEEGLDKIVACHPFLQVST